MSTYNSSHSHHTTTQIQPISIDKVYSSNNNNNNSNNKNKTKIVISPRRKNAISPNDLNTQRSTYDVQSSSTYSDYTNRRESLTVPNVDYNDITIPPLNRESISGKPYSEKNPISTIFNSYRVLTNQEDEVEPSQKDIYNKSHQIEESSHVHPSSLVSVQEKDNALKIKISTKRNREQFESNQDSYQHHNQSRNNRFSVPDSFHFGSEPSAHKKYRIQQLEISNNPSNIPRSGDTSINSTINNINLPTVVVSNTDSTNSKNSTESGYYNNRNTNSSNNSTIQNQTLLVGNNSTRSLNHSPVSLTHQQSQPQTQKITIRQKSSSRNELTDRDHSDALQLPTIQPFSAYQTYNNETPVSSQHHVSQPSTYGYQNNDNTSNSQYDLYGNFVSNHESIGNASNSVPQQDESANIPTPYRNGKQPMFTSGASPSGSHFQPTSFQSVSTHSGLQLGMSPYAQSPSAHSSSERVGQDSINNEGSSSNGKTTVLSDPQLPSLIKNGLRAGLANSKRRGNNFHSFGNTKIDTEALRATIAATMMSKGSGSKDSKKKHFLPGDSIQNLKEWFFSHLESPYPTSEEKDELSKSTGLSYLQVSNWFTNTRKRVWSPAMRLLTQAQQAAEKQQEQLQENGSLNNPEVQNVQASIQEQYEAATELMYSFAKRSNKK